MRCIYCGSYQHTIKNCSRTWDGSVNRMHMRCTYCGSREHNIEACPKTFAGIAARAWYPEIVSNYFVKDR